VYPAFKFCAQVFQRSGTDSWALSAAPDIEVDAPVQALRLRHGVSAACQRGLRQVSRMAACRAERSAVIMETQSHEVTLQLLFECPR